MSNIRSYPTKTEYSPDQKLIGYDSSQVIALPVKTILDSIDQGVPYQELLQMIAAIDSAIAVYKTYGLAKTQNLQVDATVLLYGNPSELDGKGGLYTVKASESGAGALPLDNGNYLIKLYDSGSLSSPGTYQDAKNSDLGIGAILTTTGYNSAGDGGQGLYVVVSGGTGTSDNGAFGDMSNGNQLKLIHVGIINAKQYGLIGVSPGDDTVQFQACVNYLAESGGGEMFFPPGEYMIRKLNPTGTGSSNPDDYAINLYGTGVTLRGVRGASKIVRDPTIPRYIMMRWGPLPIVNGQTAYDRMAVIDLEFDGAYDPSPADSTDDISLLWISGISNSIMSGCHVHGSSHYGLGLQNGGRKNLTITDVVVEDTLTDGIDFKNNGDEDEGVILDKVTVRRFGRSTNVSFPYAGIDVMGSVKLSNILVEEFGDVGTVSAGIRFKQGEAGESRGAGGHNSSIVNFEVRCLGGSTYEAGGVLSQSRRVKISNGSVSNCPDYGVRLIQESCTVSNVECDGCGTNFRVSDSPYPTDGDKCIFSNCDSSNAVISGFQIETDYTYFNACNSTDDNRCANVDSTATETTFNGGRWVSPVANFISNDVPDTKVLNITGFKTQSIVESDQFPITATGAIAVTASHGLPFTPSKENVSLTLLRSPNNVTSLTSEIKVTGVSSSIISARATVTTASGTAGDYATLGVKIDNSYIPTGTLG